MFDAFADKPGNELLDKVEFELDDVDVDEPEEDDDEDETVEEDVDDEEDSELVLAGSLRSFKSIS